MKHILLTISLILGATAVSAGEKVWVFNVTEVSVPMIYGGTLYNTPESLGMTFYAYKDVEECRSQLQTYVLRNTANSEVELHRNDTFHPTNPSSVLYNSTNGLIHFVECSPKVLQD